MQNTNEPIKSFYNIHSQTYSPYHHHRALTLYFSFFIHNLFELLPCVVNLGYNFRTLAGRLAGILNVIHVSIVHPGDLKGLRIRGQNVQFDDGGDVALGALHAGLVAAAQLAPFGVVNLFAVYAEDAFLLAAEFVLLDHVPFLWGKMQQENCQEKYVI